MPLTEKQKRYLKGLAHHLKPSVTVGQQGLREAVISEIDMALTAHELMKIRIHAADRLTRAELIDQIAAMTQAEVIQRIGHIVVLFKRNANKPRVALPSDW